jgi:hypothetical protein
MSSLPGDESVRFPRMAQARWTRGHHQSLLHFPSVASRIKSPSFAALHEFVHPALWKLEDELIAHEHDEDRSAPSLGECPSTRKPRFDTACLDLLNRSWRMRIQGTSTDYAFGDGDACETNRVFHDLSTSDSLLRLLRALRVFPPFMFDDGRSKRSKIRRPGLKGRASRDVRARLLSRTQWADPARPA